MTFKVTCDDNGQFFVNDEPVDRKPCGLTRTKSGKWYYSKEANVRDRLNIALKNGDITKEELYWCKDHIDRKKLWEEVKVKKGISGISHTIYLDPAASCSEAVERLSKEQQVNIDGPWYGSTICFTGQMFDKGGDKISRKEVRNIANKTGFVWLEGVTIFGYRRIQITY